MTDMTLDMQVDLCHGPHLPNTGLLKASAVNAVNRAHWRADVNNEPLQVIHCQCVCSELLWLLLVNGAHTELSAFSVWKGLLLINTGCRELGATGRALSASCI